ncbi:MAG: MFS transporter, partial [Deltaproteobacteria bacterium]|nr:MFS transporter [Deltaproteobacteria bacterium]
VGWRQTWAVFGVITLILLLGPAILFIRRSPEEMGLDPDGALNTLSTRDPKLSAARLQALAADVPWSRAEAMRTRAFWLLVITYGITSVGIAGLNLHVFAFVSDIGYPAFLAASIMSVLAFTQLVSTMFWGFLAERIEIRKAGMVHFLIQAAGLALAIASRHLSLVYAGFFLYGIGLGGSFVLREVVWANYFGRLSLGTVRGVGVLLTYVFAATGAPFFGFLFDKTGSYFISFIAFIAALLLSAVLIMLAKPPRKRPQNPAFGKENPAP